MRVLLLDPFSGAAGDMFLGALLGLGVDRTEFEALLRTVQATGWRLDTEPVRRAGFAALKVHVRLDLLDGGEERRDVHLTGDAAGPAGQRHAGGGEHHHAHGPRPGAGRRFAPAEILAAISGSRLPEPARSRAGLAFRLLAEAEARVHGTTPDKVHFHEVGALDAIVDVCGTFLAIQMLRIERTWSTPIATGSGTVASEHGVLPIPAPATAELLRGLPLRTTGLDAELTTPTGAAILRALDPDFGDPPPMRIVAWGLGAGSDDRASRANVLRIGLGETLEGAARDEVGEIVFEVDDMSGEALGHLRSELESAGALDVSFSACQMKKGRPGTRVTVLTTSEGLDDLSVACFRHATTFGLRVARRERRVLVRDVVQVSTPYGPCPVKLGRLGPLIVRLHPEADVVSDLARRHGVSFESVASAVREAARSALGMHA